MTKKVRNPKNLKVKTRRLGSRSNSPFLGKLNRPVPSKVIDKLSGQVGENGNLILDSFKLL